MTPQSTTSQWHVQEQPKDSFSVFSLLNEKKSDASQLNISEVVSNPFKSILLSKSPSTSSLQKRYSCRECGQKFSRPHNLKSHLATHSSLRPYKCGTCNHYFRRQHDLKRHQKLHTGEKPYACHHCHRAFARLDALNRHQRSEGMNACATGHHKKRADTDKNASPHAISGGADKRPTIPHLKLVNKASQPYCPPETPPHVFESSPSDSPSPPPPTRLGSSSSSSPSAFVGATKELSPINRSPTWSPPGSFSFYPNRTLPLPNELTSSFSNQYEKLEVENRALKQEINMIFQRQIGGLKTRVYDLEVENKVLRSLIYDKKSLVKNVQDIDLEA